jgi:hypothetical protein
VNPGQLEQFHVVAANAGMLVPGGFTGLISPLQFQKSSESCPKTGRLEVFLPVIDWDRNFVTNAKKVDQSNG